MKPAGREHTHLKPLAIMGPDIRHDPRIGCWRADDLVFPTRRDRMTDQRDREPEAERDAKQLGGWQTKSPALVNRNDRQSDMNVGRTIKHHGIVSLGVV